MAVQDQQVAREMSASVRQALVERIDDRVQELTRPTTTRETQRVWDEEKNRFRGEALVIEHPSLLVQLDRVTAATSGPSSGSAGYESKPAARLEAVDALQRIRREAREWVEIHLQARPTTARADLQMLAARAHQLGPDLLAALDRDVLSWWAEARVTTGWDSPAWRPRVPCMACSVVGELRVRTAPLVAVCRACGASWDSSTIGILGNWVKIMLEQNDHPIETADKPRTEGDSL